MNVVYEGFFVIDSLNSSLYRDIEYKHITTEYKPSKTHEHLYGKEATFVITGYGKNNENEGFSVHISSCKNEELRELFTNIPIPHITLSVSETGQSVNTAKLEFTPTEERIVRTKFGGFIDKPIFISSS